jgi:septum site-determining protein MinC
MIGVKPLKLQIKGIREGLLITLGEGEWADLQAELLQHIHEQASFFQGAKVALDVGNQILHAAEMGNLRDKLSDNGISLWAIISNSPTTEQTGQLMGLATRLSSSRPERPARQSVSNPVGGSTIMVQKTMRSGTKVSSNGHVIVLGDVNPGAEIVAQGSVVVWGRLKGGIYAGSEGDESAVVCAIEMNPIQLRIGDFTAVIQNRKRNLQPEIARILHSQLIIEPWNTKEGGK